MLSDNVDELHARSSCGIVGGTAPPHAAPDDPRPCSGEGDGGSGRADPLRGGGDRTVICCGERSAAGGCTISYGPWRSESGGKGKENTGETTTSFVVVVVVSGIALDGGGTVAIGVSPSMWRKSASGAMCAMRSPIGVAVVVGISSVGRTRGLTVTIGGGGGVGVARPDGALRIRRRCLSDVVRGLAAVGTGDDVRDGGSGGGGSGPVGGGLGGTSNAEGVP